MKIDIDIKVLNEDIAYLLEVVMLDRQAEPQRILEITDRAEKYRELERQGTET